MKDFLVNRDETGREMVFYPETGKKYYVEYIGDPHIKWGDQVGNSIQGSYGAKYKGSIDAKESVITTENGFLNISEGEGSPYHKIDK